MNNDLLTLYNTDANFNLPFYAKKRKWIHAYIRVDGFDRGIPYGEYFNHPNYDSSKINNFIYDYRNTEWVVINIENR